MTPTEDPPTGAGTTEVSPRIIADSSIPEAVASEALESPTVVSLVCAIKGVIEEKKISNEANNANRDRFSFSPPKLKLIRNVYSRQNYIRINSKQQ
jgi:hypothetical protein